MGLKECTSNAMESLRPLHYTEDMYTNMKKTSQDFLEFFSVLTSHLLSNVEGMVADPEMVPDIFATSIVCPRKVLIFQWHIIVAV